MTKVVFINGPAGSGKDTAALALIKHFGCRELKFAWPLKRAVAAFLGLTHEEYKTYFETEAKDQPSSRFFGRTPRSVLISFSEEWAKKLFGGEVFGVLAKHAILYPTQAPFTAISGCGFRDECAPIVNAIGPGNCLLIQLARPEHSFDGDSRSYIDLSDVGVTTTEIYNQHSKEIFEAQVIHVVSKWLGV